MKQFYLVIILFYGIINFSHTQTTRGPLTPPPDFLVKAFEQNYSNVEVNNVAYWEDGSRYIVTFEKDSYSQKGFYTQNGQWLYTEINVPHSLLKQDIFQYLDKKYVRYKYLSSILHDEPSNNFYQVEINAQTGKLTLLFGEDGSFLGEKR